MALAVALCSQTSKGERCERVRLLNGKAVRRKGCQPGSMEVKPTGGLVTNVPINKDMLLLIYDSILKASGGVSTGKTGYIEL